MAGGRLGFVKADFTKEHFMALIVRTIAITLAVTSCAMVNGLEVSRRF